ncbi:ComF family protein [Methyloligella halotolerans]|uniref:ComF family protein n=1 Tax=Methyloligella halotolerans TaxID=1177755 RepID=UPI00083D7333|nr:ComF family protein [Methyloligella halotolerans]
MSDLSANDGHVRRRRAAWLKGGLATPFRGALGAMADFLLPPVCIGCRKPIDRHGQLCGNCWAKVDFITAPLCDRLGIPLPFETGEVMLSAGAIADPPAYDRARAAACYTTTMRDLIQSFKYRDRQEGLPLFGRWLAQAGGELLRDADLLIPVPLHRSKLWSRRFNQSALLAAEVARLSGVPADARLLRRLKKTMSQVGLSADQRRRNVSGAFGVDAERMEKLKQARVVLVDDVITTGATIEACARVLRRAGAARVDALVLARAVEPTALVP